MDVLNTSVKACLVILPTLVLSPSDARALPPAPTSDDSMMVADAAIQEQISKVVETLERAFKTGDTDRAIIRAVNLINRVHDDVDMIRQVILYSARATREIDKWTSPIVLYHARVSKSTLLKAVLPSSDTSDVALREEIAKVLEFIESPARGRPPDYSTYESHIRAKTRTHQEIEPALIEHMFDVAPGEALVVFMRVLEPDFERRKAILWAERVVSTNLWKQEYGFVERDAVEPDAREQLSRLSQSEHWWARLCAAAIMRQHAEFRDPQIIARLKEDPHILVREMIAEVVSMKESKRR